MVAIPIPAPLPAPDTEAVTFSQETNDKPNNGHALDIGCDNGIQNRKTYAASLKQPRLHKNGITGFSQPHSKYIRGDLDHRFTCEYRVIWLVRNVTRMKLILILSGLLTIQAGVVKRETCDGVTVYGVCHKQEILHKNIAYPALLTADLKSNVLYFTYYLPNFARAIARLNLDTKEFKNIEGVTGAFALALDRYSHDVYIEDSDSLYKYDAVDDKAMFIRAEGATIWSVYYKDALSYSSLFPMKSLYTFENEVSKKLPDLEDTKVDQFFIDDAFIYFTNDTGLYSQKKGTKDTVLYNSPRLTIRGFALDTKGIVHICTIDGVYVVKEDSLTVEKIVDLEQAYGCAFDQNNNIVYSDSVKLVRLLPGPVTILHTTQV
ncbi:hypothetical protein K1T71_013990 [Dendrolimus kikuchii]|uniref:Uncharacterized protein n=1 Tax=Dendrolimus kikuchii TaxID=765133 RepID=A0ACC1CGN9_9NEOP|nr:hypothetical protein K1T71_013990 [Dendrolimus kikuchii]